ncbi:MAG: hypothetical protein IKG18_02930, partial [Atopobiaceae bacterium]|nr:hypothetical protein [Atopobiaceae bacterium]
LYTSSAYSEATIQPTSERAHSTAKKCVDDFAKVQVQAVTHPSAEVDALFAPRRHEKTPFSGVFPCAASPLAGQTSPNHRRTFSPLLGMYYATAKPFDAL